MKKNIVLYNNPLKTSYNIQPNRSIPWEFIMVINKYIIMMVFAFNSKTSPMKHLEARL
jgi:hypothetical protein